MAKSVPVTSFPFTCCRSLEQETTKKKKFFHKVKSRGVVLCHEKKVKVVSSLVDSRNQSIRLQKLII